MRVPSALLLFLDSTSERSSGFYNLRKHARQYSKVAGLLSPLPLSCSSLFLPPDIEGDRGRPTRLQHFHRAPIHFFSMRTRRLVSDYTSACPQFFSPTYVNYISDTSQIQNPGIAKFKLFYCQCSESSNSLQC